MHTPLIYAFLMSIRTAYLLLIPALSEARPGSVIVMKQSRTAMYVNMRDISNNLLYAEGAFSNLTVDLYIIKAYR